MTGGGGVTLRLDLFLASDWQTIKTVIIALCGVSYRYHCNIKHNTKNFFFLVLCPKSNNIIRAVNVHSVAASHNGTGGGHIFALLTTLWTWEKTVYPLLLIRPLHWRCLGHSMPAVYNSLTSLWQVVMASFQTYPTRNYKMINMYILIQRYSTHRYTVLRSVTLTAALWLMIGQGKSLNIHLNGMHFYSIFF